MPAFSQPVLSGNYGVFLWIGDNQHAPRSHAFTMIVDISLSLLHVYGTSGGSCHLSTWLFAQAAGITNTGSPTAIDTETFRHLPRNAMQ